MKHIKGKKYGSKFLSEEEIECIEKENHFYHIGTEVIKDRHLMDLPVINVSGFFGHVNEDIIYVPFTHPDDDKYNYALCEIFMRREGE